MTPFSPRGPACRILRACTLRLPAPGFFTLAPLALALSAPALAQTVQTEPPADPVVLDTVIVEASPFRRSAEELVHPADVLRGEELERRRGGTIGDVLADRPGVSNASFGPGVGRPVIRGQGGPRVQVLDNGIGSMDASSISADHAVSVDPLGADQVEIIKGPATLIYGGGASAGVVNVVDDRLPDEVTPGLRLRGDAAYGSNADEQTGALRARYGSGPWQWGAQYGLRDTKDFSIPGYAAHEVHEGEQESHGILDNSSVDTRSYGASGAWIGEPALLGLALSRFETEYGVPSLSHEGEEEAEGDGHAGPRIDLEQTRVDLRALVREPLRGFEDLEARIGVNDYRHREIEVGGAIGTQFDVSQAEARLQMAHRPLGAWSGVTGLHLSHRDFEAVGEEAFLPPAVTRGIAGFVVEQRAFGGDHRGEHRLEHRLELGARLDQTAQEPDGGNNARDQDFTAYTLSGGAAFALAEHLHLRFNVQRAQRAPAAEELYAFGPHLATASFERGDQALSVETANNLELSLGRDAGRLTWEVSSYYNLIKDYVFLREIDQGLNADGSGTLQSDGEADRVDETGAFDPEGELLLVDYRQDDARFYGAEASAGYQLIPSGPLRVQLSVFGDLVRGELDEGGNLPRITPMRLGIGADVRYAGFSGGLRYLRSDRQDRVASLETPTPGYDLLSADLGYRFSFAGSTATLYLRGRNLLDEEIRLSTSLLKDVAPLPGRSVFTGIRFDFQPA